MRIGMDIGMAKSPDAATFETGPAYEYSFAMDFSKLTAENVDMSNNTNTRFPFVSGTNRMISTADSHILKQGSLPPGSGVGDGLLFESVSGQSVGLLGFPATDATADDTDETWIEPSFSSYSGVGIPNGSLSPIYRYLSMVITYHSENSAGDDTSIFNREGYLRIGGADGKLYGYTEFHGDKGGGKDHPRFINGVNMVPIDNSVRDVGSGLLVSGTTEFDTPLTLTWDMMDAVGAGLYSAFTEAIDPAELTYHQGNSQSSFTVHGFIFSSSVPGEVTLPIHTSRPVSEFA